MAAGDRTPTPRKPRFAIAMLLVGAALNAMYGIVGLAGDDHLVSDALLFGSLEVWGGTSLAIALIEVGAAVLLIARVPSGVPITMLVVALNMLAQWLAVGAYPLWSVTMLAINALILHDVIAHGTRSEVPGARTPPPIATGGIR